MQSSHLFTGVKDIFECKHFFFFLLQATFSFCVWSVCITICWAAVRLLLCLRTTTQQPYFPPCRGGGHVLIMGNQPEAEHQHLLSRQRLAGGGSWGIFMVLKQPPNLLQDRQWLWWRFSWWSAEGSSPGRRSCTGE